MNKKEFRELCDEHQKGAFSEGFDAGLLVWELARRNIEWDDLNSHESVKAWIQDCIENDWWHIWHIIKEISDEGTADYYKIDFSMGTMARITALATADDFYEAFEDRFDN